MNLRAGTGRISLTDAQATALGLDTDAPVKIGCGESACVYAAVDPTRAVKLTKDPSDALGFWILSKLPPVEWVVPAHAVHRVGNAFAIEVTRCAPLPTEWAGPIEALYDLAEAEDHAASDWPETYRKCLREIEWKEAEHGGATANDLRMRLGLEAVDAAVRGLKDLGFDWCDWYSDNWGLYQGRPVLVDLGLLEPRSGATVEKRAREIPVLPY